MVDRRCWSAIIFVWTLVNTDISYTDAGNVDEEASPRLRFQSRSPLLLKWPSPLEAIRNMRGHSAALQWGNAGRQRDGAQTEGSHSSTMMYSWFPHKPRRCGHYCDSSDVIIAHGSALRMGARWGSGAAMMGDRGSVREIMRTGTAQK